MARCEGDLYLVPSLNKAHPHRYHLCLSFLDIDNYGKEVERLHTTSSKNSSNEVFYDDDPLVDEAGKLKEGKLLNKRNSPYLTSQQLGIYKRFKFIILQAKLLSCSLE